MKKHRILAFILASVVLIMLAGCAPASNQSAKFSPDDIALKYNDVIIRPGDDASTLLALLGDNYVYSETISCSFSHNGVDGAKGMDKLFEYPGVSFNTRPMQPGVDNIKSMDVFDDRNFTTAAGIGFGSTLEQIEATYGTGYTKFDGGFYCYANINDPAAARLYFFLEDDVVTRFGF